jgi:hypothetical protein
LVTDPGLLQRRDAMGVPEYRHITYHQSIRSGGIAVASTEVEHFDGVDPAEVPSAAFGWSKINYRTWHVVGLFAFGFLLAMLRGNHIGHVEDWFLIGFAALALFVLVRDLWGRRRGWLR